MRAFSARRAAVCRWAVAAAAVWQFGAGLAQAPAPPTAAIYSCTDDHGRRLTADRPIPECAHREQQVLNRDGSLKTVRPPTLTDVERAQKETAERAAAQGRSAQADAVRRDRNLMARFPNEASHQHAREAALDTMRLAMKATAMRQRELAAERKPLLDEAEFYKGRAIPAKLRTALDANDAALEAQRSLATNQETELGRINKLYDFELDRLRKLWAGAPPGTLGAVAPPPPAASAAARPAKPSAR